MKRRILLALAALLVCAAAILGWWLANREQRHLRFRETAVEIADSEFDICHGSDTARLTVYMFASYTCRHCRAFLNIDLPKLQNRYIDNGLVRLVIKPIDLSENPDMMMALQLAACLNRNGNADDIQELLLSDPFAVYSDEFRQMIDDVVNSNQILAECLLADDFEYIKKNNLLFSATSSKGTPIFVVAGHLYGGRRDVDRFCEIIDYELGRIN
ncbi:MAG: thioredoxin domain-containing protein [Salinivirgaceae bacterium]|nr:thioredoxin domain-containing protein [Salinivirgaceae bacterium]